MTIQDKVVKSAREWIGTRWKHQGRDKKGIDCAGLVVNVAIKHSLLNKSEDVTNYVRRSTSVKFVTMFSERMKRKKLIDVEPGDVLIFRDSMFPNHIAFVGSNIYGLTLIHAYAGRRKVVEEQYTDDWKRKATHCFAISEE